MDNIQILWVDDEIQHLKPHILFLQEKGYAVDTINNGDEALEMLEEKHYDLVFLDENMPGLSGLETLQRLKTRNQSIPVVMVTKSEEESIMEEAIGSQISDYLIKPVNPRQVLLSIKKNVDGRRLVSEKTTSNYQQEFRQIGMDLASINSYEEWVEMYKRLVYWELELDKLEDESLNEILQSQKKEANAQFFRFVEKQYPKWFNGQAEAPIMSHTLFKERINGLVKPDDKLMLVLIDNLRWDQWRVIQPLIESQYIVASEEGFCSILPTATQYARNAIFSGLMPAEIQRRFKDKWIGDNEDEGKNLYEDFFLADQLKRLGKGDLKFAYHKVTNHQSGKKLVDQLSNHLHLPLNVVVYNFVDMLSHAKTDSEMIKELAESDKAYRSLTYSWFQNSPLLEMIRLCRQKGIKLVLTTDHGTISVTDPTKLVGDRNVNTNLRYKVGRNMTYQHKDVFEVADPEKIHLPKPNINSAYVFAKEDLFFAYPNNFNHYVKYYRNTYQHGGVSLEEMIVPFVFLQPRP